MVTGRASPKVSRLDPRTSNGHNQLHDHAHWLLLRYKAVVAGIGPTPDYYVNTPTLFSIRQGAKKFSRIIVGSLLGPCWILLMNIGAESSWKGEAQNRLLSESNPY